MLTDAVSECRDEKEADTDGEGVIDSVPDNEPEEQADAVTESVTDNEPVEHADVLDVPELDAQMVVDEEGVTLGDGDELSDAESHVLGEGLRDAELVSLVDRLAEVHIVGDAVEETDR